MKWETCPGAQAPDKVGPFLPRLEDGGILVRRGDHNLQVRTRMHI